MTTVQDLMKKTTLHSDTKIPWLRSAINRENPGKGGERKSQGEENKRKKKEEEALLFLPPLSFFSAVGLTSRKEVVERERERETKFRRTSLDITHFCFAFLTVS